MEHPSESQPPNSLGYSKQLPTLIQRLESLQNVTINCHFVDHESWQFSPSHKPPAHQRERVQTSGTGLISFDR